MSQSPQTFETLSLSRNQHVLEIALGRPKKLNAFDRTMLRELSEALTLYEDDESLWCALLRGEGERAFTAGLQLDEVGPAVADGEPLFPAGGVDPLDLFDRRRTKPLVTVVHGWCLTIGIELLLASDVRVAASDTRFGQIEVCRGIMPFGGATLRFPQVAGWGNAMRYLLTGDHFDASEALRIGLVQEVADAPAHLEVARGIAERIAAQAPLAVRATRQSARAAVEQGVPAALEALMDEARGLMATEDAAEGVASFVERRAARFQGR